MPETISFGAWLRQQRRALDLTQKAFADQVGCAEITVRRMEADEYKPSNELALVLFAKLGIAESERTQWVRFARGLAEYPNNHTTPSLSREKITNLPIPLTSFIGRAKDITLIQQRLAGHRLVTLIGAGGIGKTRLSQQVASQLLSNYANGVWLVELASLSDPALVSQSIATVFGIQQGANYSALVETLIHFLRAKTILLILDNCEHLLDACAGLADKLLQNCPNLKILATSREALGVIGEALYQVPSLTIPEIQKIESIEKLNDFESIRLFNERAQLVQMDFALTKENASSVAQICSQLDGIPLAIELAAVRIQTLSAEQIADQLDQCFHVLTGGSRTALPKHQTLKASIDWSWRLLYDSEQILLRRLSVFAGGFTLEAVGQICAGTGIESRQVLGLITQLVAKSLVVVNQDSGRERRFRLLETIRQHTLEKLVESGEEVNIRTRHLKYFLQLSEQAEPALRGPEQAKWFSRLFDERDNIRAALAWASKTHDVETGLYISGRLHRFWDSFDIREGASWLDEFLRKPESKAYPVARAKALCTQGWLFEWLQQSAQARSAAQEGLDLYQACGDKEGEVDGLLLLGFISDAPKSVELNLQALSLAQSLGDIQRQAYAFTTLGWTDNRDFKTRVGYWKKAIALFRKAGDLRYLAGLLGSLGLFFALNGDIESAEKCLAETSLLVQQLNTQNFVSNRAKDGYVQIALMRGDYEQARALLQELEILAEERGDRMSYLWTRVRLAYLDVREGNISQARHAFSATTQSFQKNENTIGVVFTLEGMAGLYVAVGKPEHAARLIGWADATRKQIDDPRPLFEQAEVDKIIAACLTKIGEVAFSDAYEEGTKMSLDEAVAYALNKT